MGTVTAPAAWIPRSARIHSTRFSERRSTASPRSTPSATSAAPVRTTRVRHSLQLSASQALPFQRWRKAASPLSSACLRKTPTTVSAISEARLIDRVAERRRETLQERARILHPGRVGAGAAEDELLAFEVRVGAHRHVRVGFLQLLQNRPEAALDRELEAKLANRRRRAARQVIRFDLLLKDRLHLRRNAGKHEEARPFDLVD